MNWHNAHNQQIRTNICLTPSAFRAATDKAKVDLYFCACHFSALNYVNTQKEVKGRVREGKRNFQKNEARLPLLIYNKVQQPRLRKVMSDVYHMPIGSERITYGKVEA